MNCAKCGSVLPPNAYYCPVCNEPTGAQGGYAYPQQDMSGSGRFQPVDGYGGFQQYPQQGYQQPQQTGGAYQQPQQQAGGYPPQQSYAQYGVGSYPPGYQQPYQYGQPVAGGASRLLAALNELPKAFVDSLARPSEVLRRQMESRDRITGVAAAAAVLLFSFLCGMAVVRGLVGALMLGFSSATGVSLAGDAASLNQGVSYIAGRIAPGVGGVAALCSLLAMLTQTAVLMVYLCAIRKARFSLELLLGYASVTALPKLAFLLVMIVFSFVSPWLAALPLLCSWAVSYAQMGEIMAYVTERESSKLLPTRLICYSISIALTAALVGLVGGALIGGVFERVLSLLANVGSLI